MADDEEAEAMRIMMEQMLAIEEANREVEQASARSFTAAPSAEAPLDNSGRSGGEDDSEDSEKAAERQKKEDAIEQQKQEEADEIARQEMEMMNNLLKAANEAEEARLAAESRLAAGKSKTQTQTFPE